MKGQARENLSGAGDTLRDVTADPPSSDVQSAEYQQLAEDYPETGETPDVGGSALSSDFLYQGVSDTAAAWMPPTAAPPPTVDPSCPWCDPDNPGNGDCTCVDPCGAGYCHWTDNAGPATGIAPPVTVCPGVAVVADSGDPIVIDMAYVFQGHLEQILARGGQLPAGITAEAVTSWRAEHPDYDPSKPLGGQPLPQGVEISDRAMEHALGHDLPIPADTPAVDASDVGPSRRLSCDETVDFYRQPGGCVEIRQSGGWDGSGEDVVHFCGDDVALAFSVELAAFVADTARPVSDEVSE